MRSTLEIIIAVKECQPVTPEELQAALLVMSAIEHFIRSDLQALLKMVDGPASLWRIRAALAKTTLEQMFAARKLDPLVWLGPANTPGTPEFTRFYQAGLALLAKVEAHEEAKDCGKT